MDYYWRMMIAIQNEAFYPSLSYQKALDIQNLTVHVDITIYYLDPM